MKYFRKLDGTVCAFESDGSQDDLITSDLKAMSDLEIDKHIHPEKYLSEDEKVLLERKRMLVLSKRQFALYLYDQGIYDQVMQEIDANPRFKIEYDSVVDIERLSPTVAEMSGLLGWTDDQVDQMWLQALKL